MKKTQENYTQCFVSHEKKRLSTQQYHEILVNTSFIV